LLLNSACLKEVQTENILGFSTQATKNVSMRYFFTGPEDFQSSWEKALVDRIKNAKNQIVITQMYFHPTNQLLDALRQTANRGVKTTLITSTGGKNSAHSEKFFGHRNLVCLHDLYHRVDQNKKKNLQFYAYKQGKNGLHKKVVIVDDYICAGSSNMGEKSLVLTGDHEMNFEAQSRALIDVAMQIVETDKHFSTKITSPSITVSNRFWALIHSLGANKWG
jgi:phosphatidylserine/phosphatidylglycerophosphate/cardiolipin synthase-like enzyme